MSTSHDWEELTWAWKGWRDVTGRKMKDKYAEAVTLMNKAARKQGIKVDFLRSVHRVPVQ